MGYIFRRFHCALVKMVKVRERTAVAGRSPVGVTGVLTTLTWTEANLTCFTKLIVVQPSVVINE